MKLDWEDAGTDEPGDQNASSERVAHGYWSLGPNGQGWSVELIEQDEDLVEISSGGIHLGHFPTEGEAKAAAQAYEDQRAPGKYRIHKDADQDPTYPWFYDWTGPGENADYGSTATWSDAVQCVVALLGQVHCPDSPTAPDGTPHTVIGCGSTNVRWDAKDHVYDCLDCGIFFDPKQEVRTHEHSA